MAKAVGLIAALALMGCGVQGDPVAPQAAQTAGDGPVVAAPPVVLADGVGRVTLGPGGLRLGAAGIPATLSH
ncbi:hypothetical protein AN189_10380 [Loktanella sp. 3ANDIMAR09]|uniref:hypothetical protein n=1 Tax=Loktanella sp. 3ANDIMAR09 TaxID=1225657 RepID=UPI0006F7BA44|nr:hypothetical protein [Loktanella sp. 3ANDIMAR09]KQI68233.1 hypothetical protein AN189_10380 [Loktanella sp. 3ANDIMAR09]